MKHTFFLSLFFLTTLAFAGKKYEDQVIERITCPTQKCEEGQTLDIEIPSMMEETAEEDVVKVELSEGSEHIVKMLNSGEGGQMIFEVPCVTDPLVELYKVPSFDKFYWSFAHHWYYSKKTLGNLLDRVGLRYDLMPEQRYDISNHMWWMSEGKPGGMGKYSHVFSEETEKSYREDLKRAWLCDTIVAKIYKD